MPDLSYIITIGSEVPLKSALSTLRVAASAAEAVLGPAVLEMDAMQRIDEDRRTITIAGTDQAAGHIARVAVHLLKNQYGDAVHVRRQNAAASQGAGR